MRFLAICALSAVAVVVPSTAKGAATCETLARLSLPRTRITQSEIVPAGDFKIPGAPPTARPLRQLPAFCRITAHITPTVDSDIAIEVWLPVHGWNGKFQAVGNGGWAGAISYGELAVALQSGYASASTNTGHDRDGSDASFALGHPEKVTDFAWRSVHEMTLKAKALIVAFYGKPPAFSYWNGCSTGGKQGLKEAQKFPDDYDGIVAGAPANYWTHLMAGDIWIAQATHVGPAAYIPPAKYPLLHQAVLKACDAADGLRDGLIDDPRNCHFDPAVLACKGGQQASQEDCLSAPQIEAARKIYAGAINPRTGEQVFPGLEPGSELQWDVFAGSAEPPIVASYFKYLLFKDPNWDFRKLDLDKDAALADKFDSGLINATDPDLRPFVAHGGKLLLYHGWSDGLIAPRNTINYFNAVSQVLGRKTQESVRLFMAPGVVHCGGGSSDGPDHFDAVAALDEWVERHKPPEHIVAAHRSANAIDRTRPLCPYPQVASYLGSGSIDEAASFVCSAPRNQ
jgi:feruloyl esterase